MKTKFGMSVDIITKVLTIIGFIIQLSPTITIQWKVVGIIVVAVSFIVAFIYSFNSRTIIDRKTMINRGKEIIRNATGKVALFGGDISWADDYSDDLKKILAEGKTVEVFYPLEKQISLSKKASSAFYERLGKLKVNGVKVYYFEVDLGLRCIITDPDTYQKPDDMKVLVAKRIKRHNKDQNKNRYRALSFLYNQSGQNDICISYLTTYSLIKGVSKEY